MSGPNEEIGPCGFADLSQEPSKECRKAGLRITVRDPLGFYRSIVRCREHSDWVEATAE